MLKEILIRNARSSTNGHVSDDCPSNASGTIAVQQLTRKNSVGLVPARWEGSTVASTEAKTALPGQQFISSKLDSVLGISKSSGQCYTNIQDGVGISSVSA